MIKISNATIEFDIDLAEFIRKRNEITVLNRISAAIGMGNNVLSLCNNLNEKEMFALCEYILTKTSKEEIEILIIVLNYKKDEIENGDHYMKDKIIEGFCRLIDFLSISISAENHKSEAKPKRRAL
jgi:hypothetical protein